MPVDMFREAVRSLKGFGGVVGIFGGLPTLHKNFDEICAVFREEIPDKDQRGLWANDLMSKGAICRETFSPRHSNLNVHRDRAAYDEMRRDWPEARILTDGLNRPSMHGSWWTAMRDVIPDEAERWDLIGKCFVNQTWSSEITYLPGKGLRAFFCEWAATVAEFADLNGHDDLGLPVEPGWWRQPMNYFDAQVRHYCHGCGAPMNPRKVEDLGDAPEDFTATHQAVFTIKGRPARLVTSRDEITGDTPATKYLEHGVMSR